MSDQNGAHDDSEITAVKKLLIVSLILKGLKQGQVARVIGVSDGTLSSMFPKGLLKEIRTERKNAGDNE